MSPKTNTHLFLKKNSLFALGVDELKQAKIDVKTSTFL
jgi:hypothetical protein